MTFWRSSESRIFYHPKPDLLHLFYGATARRVSITFISIFSAIYVYQITSAHFASSRSGIISVFVYYLILFVVKAITYLWAEDLSRKIGFKGLIRLAGIPFVLFIASLMASAAIPLMVFVSPLFWGIHAAFYWWGYHGYFIKSGDIEHFGESVGELQLIETIAAIATPIAGSFIVKELGFNYLFLASLVFYIICVALYGSKNDKKQKIDIKVSEMVQIIRHHKGASAAYIGSSIDTTLFTAVWPLFLFFFFGQVLSLGAVITVGIFFAAVFSLALGKYIDKRGGTGLVVAGAPLISSAWLVRAFAPSLTAFIMSDTMSGFGQRLVNLPLDTTTYKKAIESPAAKAMLFRELNMLAGSIIAIMMALVIIMIGGSFKTVFVLASFFSLFPMIAALKSKL